MGKKGFIMSTVGQIRDDLVIFQITYPVFHLWGVP